MQKKKITEEEKDNLAAFLKIIEEVENNPEVKKKMEEDQRRYGTLTGEDLMKRFTI